MVHVFLFRGIRLLLSVLALAALTAGSTAAQPSAAPRSSLFLAPTAGYQTRTVAVDAPRGTCASFRAGSTCKLIVSAELRGRGVEPMRTGSRFLTGPHVRTGYASISICLSRETMTGRGNCNTSTPSCASVSPSGCAPTWNARVSTEYQYDGARVRRIWLDPSILGAIGFMVRTSHSFSLPRASGRGPLAIGEDITVTGSIPATRGTRVALRLRMIVSPSGGVTYTVRAL